MRWRIFKCCGAWCAESDMGHSVWSLSREELIRTLGIKEDT